jgi:hypothetical protein
MRRSWVEVRVRWREAFVVEGVCLARPVNPCDVLDARKALGSTPTARLLAQTARIRVQQVCELCLPRKGRGEDRIPSRRLLTLHKHSLAGLRHVSRRRGSAVVSKREIVNGCAPVPVPVVPCPLRLLQRDVRTEREAVGCVREPVREVGSE